MEMMSSSAEDVVLRFSHAASSPLRNDTVLWRKMSDDAIHNLKFLTAQHIKSILFSCAESSWRDLLLFDGLATALSFQVQSKRYDIRSATLCLSAFRILGYGPSSELLSGIISKLYLQMKSHPVHAIDAAELLRFSATFKIHTEKPNLRRKSISYTDTILESESYNERSKNTSSRVYHGATFTYFVFEMCLKRIGVMNPRQLNSIAHSVILLDFAGGDACDTLCDQFLRSSETMSWNSFLNFSTTIAKLHRGLSIRKLDNMVTVSENLNDKVFFPLGGESYFRLLEARVSKHVADLKPTEIVSIMYLLCSYKVNSTKMLMYLSKAAETNATSFTSGQRVAIVRYLLILGTPRMSSFFRFLAKSPTALSTLVTVTNDHNVANDHNLKRVPDGQRKQLLLYLIQAFHTLTPDLAQKANNWCSKELVKLISADIERRSINKGDHDDISEPLGLSRRKTSLLGKRTTRKQLLARNSILSTIESASVSEVVGENSVIHEKRDEKCVEKIQPSLSLDKSKKDGPVSKLNKVGLQDALDEIIQLDATEKQKANYVEDSTSHNESIQYRHPAARRLARRKENRDEIRSKIGKAISSSNTNSKTNGNTTSAATNSTGRKPFKAKSRLYSEDYRKRKISATKDIPWQEIPTARWRRQRRIALNHYSARSRGFFAKKIKVVQRKQEISSEKVKDKHELGIQEDFCIKRDIEGFIYRMGHVYPQVVALILRAETLGICNNDSITVSENSSTYLLRLGALAMGVIRSHGVHSQELLLIENLLFLSSTLLGKIDRVGSNSSTNRRLWNATAVLSYQVAEEAELQTTLSSDSKKYLSIVNGFIDQSGLKSKS